LFLKRRENRERERERENTSGKFKNRGERGFNYFQILPLSIRIGKK
tara:strand:+ start:419 stop:556 length:138 start_codon:yes stop_codon:yes gene_type:complete